MEKKTTGQKASRTKASSEYIVLKMFFPLLQNRGWLDGHSDKLFRKIDLIMNGDMHVHIYIHDLGMSRAVKIVVAF